MTKIFKAQFWPALLDIFFPENCLGCGAIPKGNQGISYCAACQQEVRLIFEPFCITCGRPFEKAAGESHHCSYCLKNDWNFRQARAAVRYQSPVTEAVKIFKYKGKMHGLTTFVTLSQQYLKHQPLSQPDLIIPVPLHIKRLRQRGFNQAFILCKKIFPEWRDRIDPHVMERCQWGRPQTELSGIERCRNVRNAFRVTRPATIKNKKILLVDDVFTTGATVNECARILLKGQASEVNVFTFARAIHLK